MQRGYFNLLLAAEGSTEFGGVSYNKSRGVFVQDDDGVIQILLEKIFDERGYGLGFEIRKLSDFKKSELPQVPGRSRLSLGGNVGKSFMVALQSDCYDGCIILSDTDNGRNTLEELEEGVKVAIEFDEDLSQKKIVCGVAIEMVEAWLLADRQAFQKAFGQMRPTLSKKPEDLYGKVQDKSSNYPKHVLKQILQDMHQQYDLDTRRKLTHCIDIEVLRQECPKGFGAFYERICEVFFPWESSSM